MRIEFWDRLLLASVSPARAGPKGSVRLSAEQIAAIDRTIRRVPEVVVKVLPKDSNSLRSVSRHFSYIGRDGNLGLEIDDGERVHGKDAGQRLVEGWDLDLDEYRKQMGLAPVSGRAPKLVHKIVLSMPPGTPPKGVLRAARNFAREKFALKYRYALVLHTDEPHPHVHLVVKAVSEQGVRLHIRPHTLREWRRDFAQYLRDLGVEANATERAVRGEARTTKRDGIYRAMLRGQSTHMRARVGAIARELATGGPKPDQGQRILLETRRAVLEGWRGVADALDRGGRSQLAGLVRRFAEEMRSPLPEKEMIARRLAAHLPAHRVRDQSPTR